VVCRFRFPHRTCFAFLRIGKSPQNGSPAIRRGLSLRRHSENAPFYLAGCFSAPMAVVDVFLSRREAVHIERLLLRARLLRMSRASVLRLRAQSAHEPRNDHRAEDHGIRQHLRLPP